jgi:hypothetical protein
VEARARLEPQSGAVGCAEVLFGLTEEEVMGRGGEDNIQSERRDYEGEG